MEYTKTIWKDLPDTSTPITADRLQNIEDGIEYLFKHGVGGGDTLPIGIILPFSDNTIPEGYLLCDGSAISRTTYADLFSVIGTTYGEGDGTTTFNLPNLKGRVPIGKDEADTDFDVLGETGGEKTHTLTVNEMPSHIHSMNSVINGTNVQDSTPVRMQTDKYSWGGTSSYWTDNAGENQPHNNLQPYHVVNYIIKVNQTTSIQAQVVDIYSTSTSDCYSCNYINSLNVYSTDEIKTNKVWIDNKDIYRKTFSGTFISSSTRAVVDLYTGIDSITGVSGKWSPNSQTPNISYGSADLSSGGGIDAYMEIRSYSNKIQLMEYSPVYNGLTGSYLLEIEYTKATD